jgi:hypothetical protein
MFPNEGGQKHLVGIQKVSGVAKRKVRENHV